jgi:hypothetical protein
VGTWLKIENFTFVMVLLSVAVFTLLYKFFNHFDFQIMRLYFDNNKIEVRQVRDDFMDCFYWEILQFMAAFFGLITMSYVRETTETNSSQSQAMFINSLASGV